MQCVRSVPAVGHIPCEGKLIAFKKISLGKINKFKEENSLLNQQWVMEPKKKVKDLLKELNLGSIEIKDFYRLKIGD